MKKGAGSRKGGAFERWVAQHLSLWLTSGASKTELIRSVSSGGWAAGRKGAEGWRNIGDLAPNGDVGERFRQRFAVECKHHREVELWQLWTADAADKLGNWWGKLLDEVELSKVEGLHPMLIFKANRVPPMVALSLDTRHLYGGRLLSRTEHTMVVEWMRMVVFPLSELFDCPPNLFMLPKDLP